MGRRRPRVKGYDPSIAGTQRAREYYARVEGQRDDPLVVDGDEKPSESFKIFRTQIQLANKNHKNNENSAKQLNTPQKFKTTLRPGETYHNFLRRLREEQSEKLKELDSSCSLKPLSEKRKNYLQKKKDKSKIKNLSEEKKMELQNEKDRQEIQKMENAKTLTNNKNGKRKRNGHKEQNDQHEKKNETESDSHIKKKMKRTDQNIAHTETDTRWSTSAAIAPVPHRESDIETKPAAKIFEREQIAFGTVVERPPSLQVFPQSRSDFSNFTLKETLQMSSKVSAKQKMIKNSSKEKQKNIENEEEEENNESVKNRIRERQLELQRAKALAAYDALRKRRREQSLATANAVANARKKR